MRGITVSPMRDAVSHRSMRRLIAALLLLVACDREPIAFPARPPKPGAAHVAAFRRDVAARAGAGAFDCRSNEACAEKHLRRNEPFYCVFLPQRLHLKRVPGVPQPEPNHPYPFPPPVTGWYSIGDGRIFGVMSTTQGNGVVVIFDRNAPRPPSHVGGSVKTPRYRCGRTTACSNELKGFSGIVIVEAIISERGTVDDVRILKPIADEKANALAMKLVRGTQFAPGTIFGYPTPVIYNLTVTAERDCVRTRIAR